MGAHVNHYIVARPYNYIDVRAHNNHIGARQYIVVPRQNIDEINAINAINAIYEINAINAINVFICINVSRALYKCL